MDKQNPARSKARSWLPSVQQWPRIIQPAKSPSRLKGTLIQRESLTKTEGTKGKPKAARPISKRPWNSVGPTPHFSGALCVGKHGIPPQAFYNFSLVLIFLHQPENISFWPWQMKGPECQMFFLAQASCNLSQISGMHLHFNWLTWTRGTHGFLGDILPCLLYFLRRFARQLGSCVGQPDGGLMAGNRIFGPPKFRPPHMQGFRERGPLLWVSSFSASSIFFFAFLILCAF